MEDRHRRIIQNNYRILVQESNISALLPLLVQKKVFSTEMISKYRIEPDDIKKKRAIFLDMETRGPYAFTKLVAALRETNQTYIANLLDPNTNSPPVPIKKHAVPFILPAYAETCNIENIQNIAHSIGDEVLINITTEPNKIIVKGSTRLYDHDSQNIVPTYSTHSKTRGLVLIINIISYHNNVYDFRSGADVDGRSLKQLFYQMGLAVEAYENLTHKEMRDVIHSFKSSTKLKGVDLVFVIIMGHGSHAGDGQIPGSDNENISTSWIEEQFDNVHCKDLQNRPKIIMYQTCRGDVPDHGVAWRIQTDCAPRLLRTRTDMLIAHSTLKGCASHRDPNLGTWYIQSFCEIMMNYAHNTHMEDIFKMVDDKLSKLRTVEQTMQTSTYTNEGFKICYVHPKVYMGDDGVLKDIYSDLPIEVDT